MLRQQIAELLILVNIMDDSPASYIHMVHHLIEECLVFNMSKEECMEALSKHANIKPVITCTVWKELEKENKEFFEAYTKNRAESSSGMATREKIQNMLSSSTVGGSKESQTTPYKMEGSSTCKLKESKQQQW